MNLPIPHVPKRVPKLLDHDATQDQIQERIAKLAQPVPLFRQGEDEPAVWVCGCCSRVAGTEQDARHCYPCTPAACLHGLHDPRTYCRACSDESETRKEAARFEKAAKVAQKDADAAGCYFAPGADEYVMDLDYVAEDGHAYAWPAKQVRFQLDGEQILERALENFAECVDWDGDSPEADKGAEFVAFVEEWNKAQTAYYLVADYSRVIVLDPQPEEAGEAGDGA